ncbi:MAG TPA: NADH-quinone oxidoreductase subunit J [Vicinamibacterales bacterium]|jgi:NADH-quinone oxidoreductase subunit J|nr:NADH-quinone oxidoreductase subunit J [Vicinamibacterales bacterium]
MEQIVFYVLAAVALLASFGVIGQRNPMHSVMLLIVSFGAYAGLYVLLDAPFTAVTQIIIYAGAIMVLFLFVVMLLNAHTEDDMVPATIGPRTMKIGVVLSLALVGEVAYALLKIARTDFGTDAGTVSSIKDVGHIGSMLYTSYSFAFEVTSILILVSMVGAVVIAGKPRKDR